MEQQIQDVIHDRGLVKKGMRCREEFLKFCRLNIRIFSDDPPPIEFLRILVDEMETQ